jgi:ABC-type bacteriocin/lantibiotic exporter with double-glycine peptidase domain
MLLATMPNDWLPVPHCKQIRSGACLPACIRMVLLYLGLDVSEARLAQMLGTRTFGTPAGNIVRLEKLGVRIKFGSFSESALRHHLHNGIPCIVLVQTESLPYWSDETYHAVVLVGLTEDTAYLNDPATDVVPQAVSLQAFLLAWAEFDNLAAVITR